MRDGLTGVAVVALLAVVAVAAGRVVAAFEAHAAADAARQLEQFHVEATAPSVQIAIAGWFEQKRKREQNTSISFESWPSFHSVLCEKLVHFGSPLYSRLQVICRVKYFYGFRLVAC